MSVPQAQQPSSGGPSWSGGELADYILHLSQSDIDEIENALQGFKNLNLGIEHVNRSNFPLPTLSRKLDKETRALHTGRGFFVIRGLDATRYSAAQNTIIYLGIASYVADQRGVQDRKGNVLSHITNSKSWTVPESQRHGIHSSKALPFHNDMGCDILALQVRHAASAGGSTCLSSARKVYDHLAATEPHVVETLTTPDWPVQTSGRGALYYLGPAMTFHDGRLMSSIDPNRFGRHKATPNADIPVLTMSQEHALQRVSEVAHYHELRLDLETGDMLFFNNWALLHRRDAYTDGVDTSRHMVRLWLRNTEKGWPVPEGMLTPWLAAYGEDQPPAERKYPLQPKKEYEIPKYSAGSAAFVLED